MDVRLVRWREVQEGDLPLIQKWLKDSETLMLARSKEVEDTSLEAIRTDFLTVVEGRKVQIITIGVVEAPVGYLKIWEYIDPIKGFQGTEIGIVIGPSEFRRQGIGTIVLERLIKILRKPIFWVTSSGNDGSIALAIKCGFGLIYDTENAVILKGVNYDKYTFAYF